MASNSSEYKLPPSFTVIDFETANHYRSSACAIALVRVEDGKIIGEYYHLLRPDPFWFHHINVGIHGIRMEDVINSPSFENIWPDIRTWIDGQILVAHNAPFDRSVLVHLLNKFKIAGEVKDYLCTLYMSRVALPELKSHKLPIVYGHLFQETFDHHQALEDCKACARIALKITDMFDPPEFARMVAALYNKPFNVRDSRKVSTLVSKIVREEGYGINKQLSGKSFVFTGELPEFSRDEAHQFVVNHGGTISGSVTKKTNILVIRNYDPENAVAFFSGTKVTAALKAIEEGQEIALISDADFMQILRTIYPDNRQRTTYESDEQLE